MLKSTSLRIPVIALAVLFGSASLAEAASFSVTGTYKDHRGTIELPLPPVAGGEGPGVPFEGTWTQTGAPVPGGGPATIAIPTSAITSTAAMRGFLIPVPALVQLTTTAGHYGPAVAETMMASGGPGDLAFCPGMTATSCTTVAAGGSQGTLAGIIKYTAGPNKFGGTMKMLVKGTGNLVVKKAALPSTVMTTMGGTIPALPFSVENNPLAGSGSVRAGTAVMPGYQAGGTPSITHPLAYKTTAQGLLSKGPVLGVAAGGAGTGTGFGFTTGTVFASHIFGAQSNSPASPYKFTVTGYDKRTAGGAGRISLVAGALSRLFPTDGSNPPEGSSVDRATMVITFVPQPALPVGSPALLGALGTLIALSAGYAVSRRR